MKLLIQPLSDKIGTTIPLPYYATDGAAALDLHACTDSDTVIAQLMVMPVARPTLKVVDALPETERGTGGFGSTGR